MTKAQALAALSALEAAAMPGSLMLSFPNGSEQWQIQLDTSHVYTGTQLADIAAYCASNGITLTAQFAAVGLS